MKKQTKKQKGSIEKSPASSTDVIELEQVGTIAVIRGGQGVKTYIKTTQDGRELREKRYIYASVQKHRNENSISIHRL